MNDTSKNVESVVRVASRLIALLDRETELLRSMKPRAIAGLQDQKRQLVTAYEDQVRTLLSSPETLRDIAPVLRAEFDAVAERFEAAVTDNRRALTAAAEAQRRLFDAVVEAVEEKRSGHRGYSAAGTLPAGRSPKASQHQPLSLTLDRHL